MSNRDLEILRHIVRYCGEVEETVKIFGKSEEAFSGSFVFRNAVSMPIMQIGELATRLTDEFISHSAQIPWKAIKGMRTFFAHQYGDMNFHLVWQTAVERIPELRSACDEILSQEKTI